MVQLGSWIHLWTVWGRAASLMVPPEFMEWRKVPQRKMKTLLSKKERRDAAGSQTACHIVVVAAAIVVPRSEKD